ncbi:MAG: 6-phosphogluconolactonase [Bacteroidota bacterium]
MDIQVYTDAEALSNAAAKLFVELSQEAIGRYGRFTVVLSGGSTPKRVHELLAQSPYCEAVDWPNVHVFWGDERCVPMDDERSNAKMAYDTLLNHVPVPSSQIHPMSGTLPPAESAAQYEALLKTYFPEPIPRFDLVFLGMGDDGHTASLFPGTTAIQEQARWAIDNYVEKVGMYRITLTAPAINSADAIAFMVAGTNKAEVLKEVLEGQYQPDVLPSQLIKPIDGELIWLLDTAAAAQIKISQSE